jgi:hypothetical protein
MRDAGFVAGQWLQAIGCAPVGGNKRMVNAHRRG